MSLRTALATTKGHQCLLRLSWPGYVIGACDNLWPVFLERFFSPPFIGMTESQSVMPKGNNEVEANSSEVSGAYFNSSSSFPCVSLMEMGRREFVQDLW